MAHSITTDSLPPPIHIAQFNEQLHARYGSTKALVFRAFGPSVSVGNHLVSLLQQVKDTVGGCDLFEVELSFRNLEYLSDLQSPPFKKCEEVRLLSLEVQRLRLKLSRAETIDTGVKSIDHCNYYAGGQGGWDDGQLNPELCVWKDLAININGYCAISYNSSDPRSPVLQAFLAAQPPRLRLGGVAITFARATATLGSLTLYIESMFKAWEIETGLQCPAELRQLLEEVRSVIDFSLPIMDEIFAQVPKHTTFDLFALTFNPPIDVEKIILSIRDI